MQVHFGLSNLFPEWNDSVVCIGTFDGVHLGHQEVIRLAVSIARKDGLPACLVTFDRHPAAILHPASCPPGLMSLERRLEKFAELGITATIVLPFDRELSELSATAFLDEILVARLKAKQLVIGHDFAMGKSRQGDAGWLRSRIPTEVVPPFEIHGRRVSSSQVRKEIVAGDLEEAKLLLGGAFQIPGVVIAGDRLGRTLGYPTANIARSFHQVLPPDGVFAGSLSVLGTTYSAAISIGTRPSVNGIDRRIEAYCLDYRGSEIYGENCVLGLDRLLREQIKFEDLDALKAQIAADVEQVRKIMGSSLQTAARP